MENKKEKKSGGKLKFIIIGIIAVAVLGAGGYFGYSKFFASKENNVNKTIMPQQQVAAQQVQGQTVQGQQAAQNASYLQQVVSAKTYDLDEFLVNLADEDGKRYLKIKISLGYDNKKLDAELEEKKPILRDAIISVLRTKKAADISAKGIDNIKMELIQRINLNLTKGQLNNIYFNELLVQ